MTPADMTPADMTPADMTPADRTPDRHPDSTGARGPSAGRRASLARLEHVGRRERLARLLTENLPAFEVEAILGLLTLALFDSGPARPWRGIIAVARGGLLLSRAVRASGRRVAVLLAAGADVLDGPPPGSLRGPWILADALTETGDTLLRSAAWLEARNPALQLSLLSTVATEASQERLGERYPFLVAGHIGTGPDAFVPCALAVPYDFGQVAADAGLVSSAMAAKRRAAARHAPRTLGQRAA